jgi:hypothetical protein
MGVEAMAEILNPPPANETLQLPQGRLTRGRLSYTPNSTTLTGRDQIDRERSISC